MKKKSREIEFNNEIDKKTINNKIKFKFNSKIFKNVWLIIALILLVSITIISINLEPLEYANGEFKEQEYIIKEVISYDLEKNEIELDVFDKDMKNSKVVKIDINKEIDSFNPYSYDSSIIVRDMQYLKGYTIFGKEYITKKYYKYYDNILNINYYPSNLEELPLNEEGSTEDN